MASCQDGEGSVECVGEAHSTEGGSAEQTFVGGCDEGRKAAGLGGEAYGGSCQEWGGRGRGEDCHWYSAESQQGRGERTHLKQYTYTLYAQYYVNTEFCFK